MPDPDPQSRPDPEKIAVVIPVYNHARFLAGTLESVLAQTRRPDRILVLDDGSTDDSLEIAKSFCEHGVEVEAQENAGAHLTINRLVASAAEDCGTIAILNSDDQYLPGRLAACLDALAGDPSIDLVCTRFEPMDDDDAALPAEHPRSRWFASAWAPGEEKDLSLSSWLGIANFPVTTSNIVARGAFLTANPMRDYRFCHDYFLLSTAAIEGRMAVLSGEPQLRYRVHASNTITTAPETLVREMARMRLELARHLAPAAGRDPAVRVRLTDFLQACWGNISSIPEAEVQLVLAEALESGQISRAVETIPADRLSAFPNKAILDTRPDSAAAIHPLGRGPELARKVAELGEEKADLKARAAACRELADIRHLVGRSRWIAIGTLLGLCRKPRKNDGSSADEKLVRLQDAIASSRWIAFGAAIGSRSCRDLRHR